MKIGLIFAFALPALTLAANAFAQGGAPARATAAYMEQSVGGDQVVTFGGDELAGDGPSIYGTWVGSPPRIMRRLLIRARMNFVTELVRSVEHL